MSSGVNMLTKSLRISDTTKTECFELIFFQSDQKYDKNTTAINMVTAHKCSDTSLYIHLSNPAFCSL